MLAGGWEVSFSNSSDIQMLQFIWHQSNKRHLTYHCFNWHFWLIIPSDISFHLTLLTPGIGSYTRVHDRGLSAIRWHRGPGPVSGRGQAATKTLLPPLSAKRRSSTPTAILKGAGDSFPKEVLLRAPAVGGKRSPFHFTNAGANTPTCDIYTYEDTQLLSHKKETLINVQKHTLNQANSHIYRYIRTTKAWNRKILVTALHREWYL